MDNKQPQEWVHKVKERFHGYPDWILDVSIAGLIGLIVGFFCRNFGRFLFFFCLSGLITLFLLEQTQLIVIREPGLYALFTNPDDTIFTWIENIVNFTKEHVLVTLALVFGFLFGWRLGQ